MSGTPVSISGNPPNTSQGTLNGSVAGASTPGVISVGSNLYSILSEDMGFGDFQMEAYKSIDQGVTWSLMDSGNGPHFLGRYTPTKNGTSIELIYNSLIPLRRTTFQVFDTLTDTWGVPDNGPNYFADPRQDVNGDQAAIKLSNGDYCVIYVASNNIVSITRTGGAWNAATLQIALAGAQCQLLSRGVTRDSSDTAYFAYRLTDVMDTAPTLNCRSLTSGGVLSSNFLVSSGLSGFSATFDQSGNISIFNNKIVIPSVYCDVAGSFPLSTPGIWEGSPTGAPTWTFKQVGSNSPAARYVFFTVVDSTHSLVWFDTSPSTNLNIWQVTYDGTTLGTPSIFYNYNTNPPTGGAPDVDQFIKQISVAPVTGGYGITLALEYGIGEDYSTFYIAPVPTGPCETDVIVTITVGAQKKVRLQVYDDGIGEYVYDKPVSTIDACGHMSPIGINRQRGVFFLPAPLSISQHGLATVQMQNIENTEASVKFHLCFVFAVPKKDRWQDISNVPGKIVGS